MPVIPTNVSVKDLLAELNHNRVVCGLPKLKSWKASKDALTTALKAARHAAMLKQHPPKVIPPAIADGAETTRFHTKMHVNKVEKAVKRMSKEDDKLGGTHAQRSLAKRINQATGYTVATVMAYILAHPNVEDGFKFPITEETRLAMRTWIDADLAKPARKRTKAPRDPKAPKRERVGVTTGEYITPAELAEALGVEASRVRAKLRSKEDTIPKEWRHAAERWSFLTAHKDDVLKLLGGK